MVLEKMRFLVFLTCLFFLRTWNVSGEAVEHDDLKRILEEFESRILEKVRDEIGLPICFVD